MGNPVFVPVGGAKRLAVQACSRLPDPERGLGFQHGVYHNVEPVVLAGTCLEQTLFCLPHFRPEMLSGVILTCANPTGPQNMTGRTLVNWIFRKSRGYLDESDWRAWGNLVNQLCMSGLRGQLDAANMLVSPFVRNHYHPMVIAIVGMEKMTECRLENIFGRDYSAQALAALGAPATAMGYTAEMTADRFDVTKDECDEWALAENSRYRRACAENWFRDEIVPITVDGRIVDQDAPAELLTPEKMRAAEKFFFRSAKKGGKLTQFTSSQMSDGAACVVLCNEAAIIEYDWKPLAKMVGGAIATVPAEYMGEGLLAAFEEYLAFAGLEAPRFNELYGALELNTAFASIPLALAKEHGMDLKKINIAGGATTPLGHPLGATGVRLTVTLLHLMKRFNSRFGGAGACVGEGQGGFLGYELCVD